MISLHGVRSKKSSKGSRIKRITSKSKVKVKQVMATEEIMSEVITKAVVEVTRVAIQAMAEA